MASQATALGPLGDAHLQFNDTNLGKELKIHTYNDLYRKAERADRLYTNREELSEDEDHYRSDMLSLKAFEIHYIAAKPEVLPCKDLFSHALNCCKLKRGCLVFPAGTIAVIIGFVFCDLYKMPKPDMVYTAKSAMAFLKGKDSVKEVLRDWAEDAMKIKHRSSIDYLISYFRKGVIIGMAMLNKLWGKADIDHVDQLWVPLLGCILMHDRRPNFAELLTFNLHQNWGTAKEGNSFFMASYVVDVCCASLRFNHPQFPKWPHQSKAPIHVLFEPLYIYKYHRFITTICEYFYPVVYRAIRGTEMPRLSDRVRDDLSNIRAWWFFNDHIVIRVEGMLTVPNKLPIHVLDWLASFQVVVQCLLGVAEKYKNANQKPYPHVPFSIGDMYFQTWPSLVKFRKEVDPMNFLGKATKRMWDPFDRGASPPAHTSTSIPQSPKIMVPPISTSTEKIPSGTSPTPPPFLGPSQEPEVKGPPKHREVSSVTLPNLARGIRVSPLVSLKTPVWKSLALPLIPRPPHPSPTVPFSTGHRKPVLTTSVIPAMKSIIQVLPPTHFSVPVENMTQEEVVERMHLELTHDRDKIVAPPSMGTEIMDSIKELYKSFTREEEARGRGEESLLDSAGLPPVRKLNDSTPTESELDTSLGEFTGNFSQQLASVEERGNQAIHEFVVQVARKVEQAQFLKETLDPVLAEHTQVVSRELTKLQGPIVDIARIELDYDKYEASRGKGKAPLSGMEHRAGQNNAEGDQPIPHSSRHEARWEANLMAKEMTKSLEVDIATLDSRPTPIPRDDPLSGPSSTGQPILEYIDRDNLMHDGENGRR
eukprot:Gb_14082 [translate_table: standard]